VKQAFSSFCAVAGLLLLLGSSAQIGAQTASATPDPVVAQLTASATNNYVGDVSGNGRFVVVESNGDIATEKVASVNSAGVKNTNARNNEDGNREIFLIDYAQRRIFQITDTKSALKDPTKPPIASTTPGDFSNIVVEVSNNRPMISNDGRWIVFSSNASTPGKFDGSDAASKTALLADGNQEIFLYKVPQVADVDLSRGTNLPKQDLDAGEFIQVTSTTATRVPVAGTTTSAPVVADDNRDATVVTVDDGDPATLDTPIVAFVSVRDVATIGKTATVNNADSNPEVFIYNGKSSPTILQVTNTTGGLVFNENPALSDNGSVLAFVSNSNMTGQNNDDGKGNGDSEIFVANYNGTSITSLKQVTQTKQTTVTTPINIFNRGRRVSRDGTYVAFESSTDNPKTGGTIADPNTLTVFVYNTATDTFTQVGPRAATGTGGDVRRYPVFTDYNSSLSPGRLLFVSALNFKTDGTFPSTASEGLNPLNQPQIFSAPLPAPSSITFTRLTNNPVAGGVFPAMQVFASNTVRRTVFSEGNVELGGGNADLSVEAFYLLTTPVSTDAATTLVLSYFTKPTQRPVVAASPTPSPSPSADSVPGLAPGEFSTIRATGGSLAPSKQDACSDDSGCASESARRPALPIELNGISVSVNGAAAGLYSVTPDQIDFVIPPGLNAPTTTDITLPVIVFNSNTTPTTVIRSRVPIVPAQPDIVSPTNGPDGRAVVKNVTNPNMVTDEPFSVTTTVDGKQVPTVLRVTLTGVRRVTKSQVSVIIGDTTITGDAITIVQPLETPGFEQIYFTLPSTLANGCPCDLPIVVSVTINGQTFTSRPKADTPPKISINP
jgi:uncharacterized protein (TIGR03437 family)